MTSAAAGPTGFPAPPPAATRYFPDHDGRGALARRYACWLAGPGVERGLIGPREVSRLWERHLLNCAAVRELIVGETEIVDVGSGAGLPGLPLVLAVPDLTADLLEPLQRRAAFLTDVVSALGLAERVRVTRGRAEEPEVRTRLAGAHVVLARAVAPLDRLARWCAPLLAPGGRLLALKGERAEAELRAWRHGRRYGLSDGEIVECGVGLAVPTRVVVLLRGED